MGRVNYQEMRLSGEALPLIKSRIKKIKNRFSRNNNKKETGKILVICTCIIGDFLSYLPAIRELIKKNHGKRVDMIVSPLLRSLAEKINGIGKIFVAKSAYNRSVEARSKQRKQAVQGKYDSLVIMRISRESYRMIKDIDFSDIMVPDLMFARYLLHLAKNMLIKRPIKQSREFGFELIGLKKPLEQIDKDIDLKDIFIFTKKEREKIARMPELKTKDKIVLIHTGSGWREKLWSNDKWIVLIKKVNQLGKFRFIFVGATQQEEEAFREIKNRLDFKVYSVIGKNSLRELFLFMEKSDYLIGIDSGPRNLSHLADMRSVTIRGPGTYFKPLDKRDIVIDRLKGLSTNPFFPDKDARVDNINVEEVLAAFKKIMKKGR